MTTDTWNAAQYNSFQREREQPFVDLLELIDVRPRHARRRSGLRDRAADAAAARAASARAKRIGIDRSANMLEEQRAAAAATRAALRRRNRSSRFRAPTAAFDLVFSNAALHWVDRSRARCWPGWPARCSPSGQLAFQVPASHDDPVAPWSPTSSSDVEPYRTALGGWRRPQPRPAPEAYARILHALGFRDPKVRLIVYPHVLAGPEGVLDWMKGTLLTEYARHLPPEMFEPFVREYWTRAVDAPRAVAAVLLPVQTNRVLGTTCLRERATEF